MIELGKRQLLTVVKKVDFGVYLAERMDSDEKVLLPIKQVPKDIDISDTIDVFIYRDSKDRLISTVKEPKIQVGQVARLKVLEVSKIGAFLDCGLEKDLLLPFKQQTRKVRQGEDVLVAMYIDKSSRLCATMNVYEYLSQDSPYNKDDKVKGVIYETSDQFGAFVAVDDKYSALIPKKELHGAYQIGDIVEARVISVKEDGKLNLSPREKAYLQMDADSELVMKVIEEYAGVLPFTDKASPEVIDREFGLSKNAFKRAVGRLLKEGKVEITDKAIKKINK